MGESKWAHPLFIIAKKDGLVLWVSNLQELNKVIKQKVYPLPFITYILHRCTGYKFFTKLDISMQCYTFKLNEEIQESCAIITPLGKYKFKRLPMGLKCAPEFAQQSMENILQGIDDSEVYLDDIGCFSNEWRHHLKLLDRVLTALQANGFTINPRKCEWAVQETDWLGYLLTHKGLKPWRKKIDAILHMDNLETSSRW